MTSIALRQLSARQTARPLLGAEEERVSRGRSPCGAAPSCRGSLMAFVFPVLRAVRFPSRARQRTSPPDALLRAGWVFTEAFARAPLTSEPHAVARVV